MAFLRAVRIRCQLSTMCCFSSVCRRGGLRRSELDPSFVGRGTETER